MMRKTGILTLLFVTIYGTFGCGNASSGLATNKASEVATSQNEISDTEPVLSTYAANTAAKTAAQTQNAKRVPADKISLDQTRTALIDTAPTDRKIIRNADLSLESESPEETQRRITAIAESHGGFVVESQQTSSDVRATTRDIVSMSVRVPSQKFADTLDQIRQTSERVVFETVKGDDVTEEFIDVEARLKAKKALEQQFVEIMKRASNVEDALNVQSQLGDVRSEIERIEGRKRFLENQSSLSTIKIKLQTPAVFSASSSGFSHRLGESLATGFDFALNFVLGLVTLVVATLPFVVFIGLPVFFGFRYFWKKQSRPKSVSEIAKEELKVT
ncbi:MAG: DUF4349 domain-containing protein [Pyrinomonadaceae bacterium]